MTPFLEDALLAGTIVPPAVGSINLSHNGVTRRAKISCVYFILRYRMPENFLTKDCTTFLRTPKPSSYRYLISLLDYGAAMAAQRPVHLWPPTAISTGCVKSVYGVRVMITYVIMPTAVQSATQNVQVRYDAHH